MSISDPSEARVRLERRAAWMEAMTRGQGGGQAHPSEGCVGALGCEERGEDARCGSIDNSGAGRIVWDLDWESDLDAIRDGKLASGGTSWRLGSPCARCCVT